GLAGPEVGRGRLFDDVGGNADHVRELPDLRLVQVAEWIDGAGKVTVDGSVSEQELGFVARPQDQGAPGPGLVIQDRHPLPGHLVATPLLVGVREPAEVGVDLGADVTLEVLNAELAGNLESIPPAL